MLRSPVTLWLSSIMAFCAADKSFVLPPPAGKSGETVALVLIQGASSPPGGYRPFLEALQKVSPLPLWVGVPEFIADTPQPLQFNSKLKESLGAMAKAGMVANRTVLLAHSLGGVFAQQHVVSSSGSDVDALVLYGATVLRKYRNATFAAPVLTVDGELDGLLRISRQAEAWWHQVHRAGGSITKPVALLPGLNHWSISSGPPPPNVRSHDLPSEVAADDGHAAIASVVSSFLVSLFGSSAAKSAAATAMTKVLDTTAKLVAPLIEALELEGSSHLNPPCESDYPTNPSCAYPKWPDKSLLPVSPTPNAASSSGHQPLLPT